MGARRKTGSRKAVGIAVSVLLVLGVIAGVYLLSTNQDLRRLASGANCGNGVVNSNEQCDDGNLVDGDGCSSGCNIEAITCINSPETVVKFEDIAPKGVKNDSRLYKVSDQYKDSHYITFHNDGIYNGTERVGECSKEYPIVAIAGNPERAFINSPWDFPDKLIKPSPGFRNWFLTDDANVRNGRKICTIVIDYERPTYEANFYLADIDGHEDYLVQALDYDGNVVFSGTLGVKNKNTGNGLATRFVIPKQDTPIFQVRIGGNKGGRSGGWVTPLDNYDPFCSSTRQCGNGVVEPGEQCDDGNRRNGDGCSRQCQSEGVCGNGYVDEGEQCDDGNLEDGDGCSSTCQEPVVTGDPNCPLTQTGNSILINISDKIRADKKQADSMASKDVNIPAGTYKLTLASYDEHSEHGGQDQDKERYFVRLFDKNGQVVTESGLISDLPDEQDYIAEVVDSELEVSADITKLTAVHNEYPSSSPESLYPICMLFEPQN